MEIVCILWRNFKIENELNLPILENFVRFLPYGNGWWYFDW